MLLLKGGLAWGRVIHGRIIISVGAIEHGHDIHLCWVMDVHGAEVVSRRLMGEVVGGGRVQGREVGLSGWGG